MEVSFFRTSKGPPFRSDFPLQTKHFGTPFWWSAWPRNRGGSLREKSIHLVDDLPPAGWGYSAGWDEAYPHGESSSDIFSA